jgi:hypothetical protein
MGGLAWETDNVDVFFSSYHICKFLHRCKAGPHD